MWKKCKVLRLQTFNNDGAIYVNPMESKPYVKGKWKLDQDKFQYHLYFISDDEIKKGNWVYDKISNKFYQANNQYTIEYSNTHYSDSWKKIIASTDTSLNVARPSDDFIKEYCYKGGINEVMVEFEEYRGNNAMLNEIAFHGASPGQRVNWTDPYPIDYRVKVNSDNIINIKNIKDSWNRKEIENFILQKLDIFYMNIESKNHRLPLEKEIKDFLRENL